MVMFLFSPAFAQEAQTISADGTTDEYGELMEATNTEEKMVTEEEVDVTTEIEEDETVSSVDLGIVEPTTLPDSPFYFTKDWSRGFRLMLTFNPVKKVELQLKFADERLKEAEKLAEKTGNEELLTKAIERYETATEKIETRAEKLRNSDNPDTDKFLNKLADRQIKHQKIIDRLSKKLPEQAKKKIEAVRERYIERFANIVTRLDTPEKLGERLDKIEEIQKGSKFKNFKNLEVLSRIEEKLPEQAKEAIQKAQENSLKRLLNNLNNMSPEDQEKFKAYVSKMEGNELRHAEIIDRLESEDLPEELREKIEATKEHVIEKAKTRIENIKDENKKDAYLKRLEDGDLNKLRILNHLEDKLSGSQQAKIKAVKIKAVNKLSNKIEKLDDDKKEILLQKVEKANDTKTFRVINDLRETLPENKRGFVEKMETRAVKRIQDELENAGDDAVKEKIIERISGNTNRHIQILKRVQNNVATSARSTIGRIIEKTETRVREWGATRKCTKELKPVCAMIQPQCFTTPCDPIERTFSNSCLAKEAGAKIKYEGRCKSSTSSEGTSTNNDGTTETSDKLQVFCTTEYKPVCGVDGRTYSNACKAKVAKVEVKHKGKCTVQRNINGINQIKPVPAGTPTATPSGPVPTMNAKEFEAACLAKNGAILESFPIKCKMPTGRIIESNGLRNR